MFAMDISIHTLTSEYMYVPAFQIVSQYMCNKNQC